MLVSLTNIFDIPIYLDSVGTIIVAVLGGGLPGIIVGFLSNCMTALTSASPDPMTMYYGFISVLIAVAAAELSKRGFFLKWYGRIASIAIFATIGGVLGSVVTWVLYGFSFGNGRSASLAQLFFQQVHMGKFPAQFAADVGLDFIDKIVTVVIVCIVLSVLPKLILEKLPLGALYIDKTGLPKVNKHKNKTLSELREENTVRKHSIHTKIIALILTATIAVSVVAVMISVSTYRELLVTQCSNICGDVASLMIPQIDADRIDEYLEDGEAAKGYTSTEEELYEILDNAEKIKYMYVYDIREDGCHVVFDLDSDGLKGEEPGTIVNFDDSFPYLKEVVAGKEIPPIITNDTYGWLLTVYKPIVDSSGEVAAYAAADIDMKDVKTSTYIFLIKIVSLLFGMMIIISMFALWYTDKTLLGPMGIIEKQAREFDYDGIKKGNRVRDHHVVESGDELEEIFKAMCRTEDTIADYLTALNQKNLEISLMQRNIIYTLANMVENRDENTGGHIERTAKYVRLIGEKLKAEGIYAEIVNDEYIERLCDSAPLHDIGKIKISDAVLNKPGKLTPEEFNIMKTHATEGSRVLKQSLTGIEDESWLSVAIDMAQYHHEKWSGKGYPEGKSGNDIPLCARIMAVSDVFDALVSEHSYKKAYTFETAMEIIRKDSGSHFDPEIVKAFIASEKEIQEIMKKV